MGEKAVVPERHSSFEETPKARRFQSGYLDLHLASEKAAEVLDENCWAI